MGSHKDRPTGFKVTAAELAMSDGSQSPPCLVYKELVYDSSAACKLLSKSCKLHTSKSAQLNRVYPFVSSQKTWKGSLPHCLTLHKLKPSYPLAWVHTGALPLAPEMVWFPDSGVRSFWSPSATLFLRRSKKKHHSHGEVRQIPHYFTSSGSCISFHHNLLCFSLILFFLVDQQSHHGWNVCTSSCDAQSHREMFQVAIRLTGQLKL